MRCVRCGKEIAALEIDMFNWDGSDEWVEVAIDDSDREAVVVNVSKAWTGDELSDDEKRDTIRCPNCKRWPFKSDEIQTFEYVEIVMFKGGGD